jgi:RNA polymerase sigma-70 factor (ECF subfamily)
MPTIRTATDAALINDFIAGDNSAFESLLYRHKDKIYTAIFMLVKDKYLAEDIFQEAFLKMLRTMREGRYSEQGKFLPWALRVAHNLCMDHFRRVKPQISITLQDGRDLSEVLDLHTETVGDILERRQSHETVRALIEQLPDEQREVVALRIYGDLSFKEIASITGVSINTALGRMRYALINLRKMLEAAQITLR